MKIAKPTLWQRIKRLFVREYARSFRPVASPFGRHYVEPPFRRK